ncbi:MAG: FkbM family methyltransferase [Pirellulales bacterium]
MAWGKSRLQRVEQSSQQQEWDALKSMSLADQLIYRLRQVASSDELPIEHFRELTQTLYQMAEKDFHRAAYLGITQIRHGQDAIIQTLIREIIHSTPFTVIDVGANDGWFIERVQQSTAISRLLAFEPIPDMAKLLHERFGSDPRLQILDLALGNEIGVQTLHIYPKVNGLSSLLDFREDYHFLGEWFDAEDRKTVHVQTTTLDEFAKDHLLADQHPRIALKIDVQGFEWQVLEGAKELLKSGRVKTLLIELVTREKYAGSKTMVPILKHLEELGFAIFDIHPFYREQNMIFQECHRGRLTELDCLLVHEDYLGELERKERSGR